MLMLKRESLEVAERSRFSWITLKQARDIWMKVVMLFLVPSEDSIPVRTNFKHVP